MEIITAIQKDAYNPTIGSTPQIIAKEIASGISANATVIPDKTSPLTLENHELLKFLKLKIKPLYLFIVHHSLHKSVL